MTSRLIELKVAVTVSLLRNLGNWPFLFIFTFLGSDHVHLCITDYFRYFESYLFNDNGSKFHFFKIHLCTSAQAPQLWWRGDDLSGRGLLCEAICPVRVQSSESCARINAASLSEMKSGA